MRAMLCEHFKKWSHYRQISNIKRTKYQSFNVSRFILHFVFAQSIEATKF